MLPGATDRQAENTQDKPWKEIKLSLFTDDMICYVDNLKKSIKNS